MSGKQGARGLASALIHKQAKFFVLFGNGSGGFKIDAIQQA
jgi:hypothetical protein